MYEYINKNDAILFSSNTNVINKSNEIFHCKVAAYTLLTRYNYVTNYVTKSYNYVTIKH